MQHKQQNYKIWLLAAALAASSFCVNPVAQAAGTNDKPDILTGSPSGPCDPKTDSADYVGGTDVNGHPVAAADLDKVSTPVPGHIQLPVRTGQGRAYVDADGKTLAPLLNPPSGCASPH